MIKNIIFILLGATLVAIGADIVAIKGDMFYATIYIIVGSIGMVVAFWDILNHSDWWSDNGHY